MPLPTAERVRGLTSLPAAKYTPGGTIASEADLRVLKDVVAGENIPRLSADLDMD